MFEGDAVVVVLDKPQVRHDQIKQLLACVRWLTDDVQLGSTQQHHLQTAQARSACVLRTMAMSW